jgi:hypothetical protein
MVKAARKSQARSRKSREVDDRENEDRGVEELYAQEAWTQPSLLDAPPARPGMHQRWVNTSILGKDVPHHVTKRQREGWSPRPADTVPEGFPVPTLEHGPHAGCVGVEGMILMEMPEARVEARRKFFATKTSDQQMFVDAQLGREEHQGGIPITQDKRLTSSRGQRVMDD